MADVTKHLIQDRFKGVPSYAPNQGRGHGNSGGGGNPGRGGGIGFGQSQPMQDWRAARPTHEGGLGDPTAREAFHTGMSAWQDARPAPVNLPPPPVVGGDNQGNAWGQSPQMTAWRDARPAHPSGGLGDPAVRGAFRTGMENWRGTRPRFGQ